MRVNKVMGACVALFGLLGLCQSLLGAMVAVLRDQHRLGQGTAGVLVSAFFAGCLVSTLTCGALRRRWLRPGLYQALLLLVVTGILGLALLPLWQAKVAATAVFGLGFGGLALFVNTFMAGRPGRRGLVLANLINGVFGVGAIVGPLVLGATLWAGPEPVLVLAALALAALIPVGGPRLDLQETDSDTQPPTGPGSNSRALTVSFGALLFCYAALEAGLSTWQADYLVANGTTLSSAASLTALFWSGLAVSRLCTPLIAARALPQHIVIAAVVCAVAATALLLVRQLSLVGFVLAGLFAGPVMPSALAWISQVTGSGRRVTSIAVACAMVGGISLPALIGLGMQRFGVVFLPVAVMVIVSAAAGVAVFTDRLVRRG